MRILTTAAVNAINWYQSDLSPKKGFCCAYRIQHRGLSCSAVIKHAFSTRGFVFGIYSIFSQANKCHSAAASLHKQKSTQSSKSNENENGNFCAAWAAGEGAWWCCFMPFLW
jgi:putative component of membrane protein insertase Oxa1/YidC/SpoIIIJ protein YidD